MKRQVSTLPIGTTQKRHKVKIESDPCVVGSLESRFFQFDLISKLANQPDLSTCGSVDFQRMLMYHNGSCWVAEFEAIVETA